MTLLIIFYFILFQGRTMRRAPTCQISLQQHQMKNGHMIL